MVLLHLFPASFQQAPASDALPGKTIPQSLGFNVHLTGPEKEWDRIRDGGVKFIRKDFVWSGIERARGEYDFRTYDRMVDSLEERGIRALFILDYRNRLYPNPETSEEGREAYARWAAASAKHFKKRRILWEIWNEPNVGFWHGEGKLNSAGFASQYVALVKKTVPAMRAADPHCIILGGSVSCLWRDSFLWIDEAFRQGLLDTGIDGLSVHPYGFPRPELCMEGGRPTEGYALLREKMAGAGAPGNFPVLNTEVGYSTRDRSVGPRNLAAEHQAMLFVRTFLVDQMCGIRMTIWYNWDGNGGHEVRGGGPAGRPVYRACKNLVSELTGYHHVERLDVGSRRDYVLALENPSKRRKIVAWTTPPGRDDSPDRAERHEVTIPTGVRNAPVPVRDLYGRGVPVQSVNGTIQLTLSGSPQYIECVEYRGEQESRGPVPADVNIARGKPASASSAAPWASTIPGQTGWDARYANDGDDETRWCPDPHDVWTGHWWKVDLGKRQALGSVEILFERRAKTAYRYKIEVSDDDVTYTMALDLTANTIRRPLQERHEFPAGVSGRYVRWTCTGGFDYDHWPTFHEFRLTAAEGEARDLPRKGGEKSQLQK